MTTPETPPPTAAGIRPAVTSPGETVRAPEDRLSQYLQTMRRDEGNGQGSSEAARRVEAVIAELAPPVVREQPGAWTIDADVGPVSVSLSDDGEVLSIWQTLCSLKDPGKPETHAEFFEDLLFLNESGRGACLAISRDEDGGEKAIFVVARLRAPTLGKAEFAMALEDVFSTSKLFDLPAVSS